MSQLEELRRIIAGDSTDQLSQLKHRIENIESRTKDVLEVLPPAIDAGIKQDDRLITALKAPVSESLKRAIRAEPKAYAEILYPVMGPSIRTAIANAISSLLATIDQSMQSATSVSGLKMRFESIRTGIPYGELALRNSLQYKVEHVYLIDRDSGLMIAEAASLENERLDSDAVSAMFSAIQSFVQDSFSKNPDDRLTNFKVGEHNVWITHGPRAMLAHVIYGDAPEAFKYQSYDALDEIRTQYSQQLSEFDGDTAPFYGIEDKLAPLLQAEIKDPNTEKRKGITSYFVPLLFLVAGLFLLSAWITNWARVDTVHQYLQETPGMVVFDTFREKGNIVVEGIQDPLAEIPFSILDAHGVDRNEIEFRTAPFQSLEASIEVERFRQTLSPPSSVEISRDGQVINLVGIASLDWLLLNDSQIRHWYIDGRLEASQLTASLESLKRYFESTSTSSDSQISDAQLVRLSQTPWLQIPFGYFGTYAN